MMEKRPKLAEALAETLKIKGRIEKFIISEGNPMFKSFIIIVILMIPFTSLEYAQISECFNTKVVIAGVVSLTLLFVIFSYIFYFAEKIYVENQKLKKEVILLRNFRGFVFKKLKDFHEYDKRNAIFNNYTVCKNTLQEILNYYIKLWGRK